MSQEITDLQAYHQKLQDPDYAKTVISFIINKECDLSSFENINILVSCFTLVPHLSNFKAMNNKIGDEQIWSLLCAFRALQNLHSLNLDSNQISNFGAKSLALALPSLQHLSCISLNNNPIKDAGMIALGGALSKLTNLQSLSIYGTKITPKGAIEFAALLQGLKYLVTGMIDHEDKAKLQNELCKNNVAKITEFYDQNPYLKELIHALDPTAKTLPMIRSLLQHPITPKLMEQPDLLDEFVEYIKNTPQEEARPLWYDKIESQLFSEAVVAQEDNVDVVGLLPTSHTLGCFH